MNVKEKIAQDRAEARYPVQAPAGWKTYFVPVLFLAFLIPGLIGQRTAAQAQPGPDYALYRTLGPAQGGPIEKTTE
jgi:hypothetical protein